MKFIVESAPVYTLNLGEPSNACESITCVGFSSPCLANCPEVSCGKMACGTMIFEP